MPLYDAVTKNSPVREELTFDNRVLACKLYMGATVDTVVPDVDGWYIQPGTIVKLVGDMTVAPCTDPTDVPFGIVEAGISIAEHSKKTPLIGMQVGVIPFVFGQAVVAVKVDETLTAGLTAGDKAKFTATGVVPLASGDAPQCIVVVGGAPGEMIEVII